MSKIKISKKMKIWMIVILAVVVAGIILGNMKPTKQDMIDSASDEMKQMIESEKESSRKHVTTTFNNLIVIEYCSFSSSGANAMKESYVGFANHIYSADEGGWKITGQMVNYTYQMLGCGQNILHGVKLTLLLTTLSTLIGFVFSIFLALGKISKNPVLSKICSAYIFFFRGTPLLIQLFVIYFALPGLFKFAWRDLFPNSSEAVYMGSFIAALISFSLNSAAYLAEIVRAAIQSIDKGQHEAAKALGMSKGQTMRLVVIPQSVRRMIPPICNEFVMMIKDVSLVFAISLMDITTISKTIMTSEGSYLVFIPALIIYLIITAIFTAIFNRIEKHLAKYE